MIRNIGRILSRDNTTPVKWSYILGQTWWHFKERGFIFAIDYIWYWQIKRYCRY